MDGGLKPAMPAWPSKGLLAAATYVFAMLLERLACPSHHGIIYSSAHGRYNETL